MVSSVLYYRVKIFLCSSGLLGLVLFDACGPSQQPVAPDKNATPSTTAPSTIQGPNASFPSDPIATDLRASSKLANKNATPSTTAPSTIQGPSASFPSDPIVTDLRASATLQATYKALLLKTNCRPGKNTHCSFVGIQGMKDALREMPGSGNGNLNKFKAWAQQGAWEQFGPSHHHYDWWMFPIDRSTSQGLKYTVFQQDIAALKQDTAWLQDYRLGAVLLMQSWGWNVSDRLPYPNPTSGQKWRNWDVRLGKLAHSLILFEQWDLYESLQAYVVHLRNQGVVLQAWVLQYFN